jgi:ketosteroid isomerase-like protein
MTFEKPMSDEELAMLAGMQRSSWESDSDDYSKGDPDSLAARYAADCISMPAHHPALHGRDEVRSFYATRTGGAWEMNVEARADRVDVVGDIAVIVGTFRVTRRPEQGVAGLDHGGRYLTVLRRVDGEWKLWRDMDTPSPDADIFYETLPRGW